MSLASRGLRDMDNGPESVDDAAMMAQIRKQAARVKQKAFIAAIVATAAVTLAPI